MTTATTLVLGIGNSLLTDEGVVLPFEVAALRLSGLRLPPRNR